MLAYVDDIPIAEIAQMLGSSVSSTYSLLTRARNELRSHLTEDLT
jgi:DNA-directed RNA polymerase specialized sigma24 family protein